MKKLLNLAVVIFLVGSISDLMSTLSHSSSAEANPLASFFWINFGIMGIIIASVILGIFILTSSIVCFRITQWRIFPVFILILGVLKIMVSLTNFGILPDYFVNWFLFY